MKHLFHLTRFILKTVYFSPVNNPLFYCQLMVMGLFLAHGSLRKFEVVVFLLLSALSHRLMPSVRFSRQQDTSDSRTGVLTQAIQLLPVKKRVLLSAFLIAGTLYISIPLFLCYYAGTRFQNPPTIISVCPTQIRSKVPPNGDTLTFVEGIVVSGHRFRIPFEKSILFGYLASEPVFLPELVPDSVLKRVCPPTDVSPGEIFSGQSVFVQPVFRDPFLIELQRHLTSRILVFIIFAFVFFFYDGVCIFLNHPATKQWYWLIKGIDGVLAGVYVVLWGCIVLDLLLPQSYLAWFHSYVFCNRSVFLMVMGTAGILCIGRIIGLVIHCKENGGTAQ